MAAYRIMLGLPLELTKEEAEEARLAIYNMLDRFANKQLHPTYCQAEHPIVGNLDKEIEKSDYFGRYLPDVPPGDESNYYWLCDFDFYGPQEAAVELNLFIGTHDETVGYFATPIVKYEL